jgi:endo-1,3-1,4-beta-glycanase ExoK
MKSKTPLTAVIMGSALSFAASLAAPRAETIRQDFNSMADLATFWNVSTWGGDNRTHSAQNVAVADGILSLKLSGSKPGGIPVCAEITSKRSNFRYGSYRASIKTSKTAGGVVGWFIYRGSPLNEIDVEMLTKDNKDLHHTLHHIQTSVDYKVVKMAFDPSEAFHEYRFDWYADKVAYFVDGKPSSILTKQVPDMDAQIMLNHWSGNIQGWGGPAPAVDMFMYVDWMIYSTEYGSTTGLEPMAARTGKPELHPARLAFDGGGMRAIFPPAGRPGPGSASAPARLFTVQGRMSLQAPEPADRLHAAFP